MAITKKSSMTEEVFSGISAVYAVAGGFELTESSGSYSLDLSAASIVELPVSESGGVNINGGTPSNNIFRVHGLNAPWASRMTPGDAEVTLQVPTYDDTVLDLLYGENTGKTMTVTTPTGLVGTNTSLTGLGFGFPQKSVYLGLLIVNDTEDKALFIKKVKLLASPQFDGENTPFAVNLTGTVASSADPCSIAILAPASNS